MEGWDKLFVSNFDEDKSDFTRHLVVSEKEIEEKIACFGMHANVAESNKDVFKTGISFDSFYNQVKYQLSDSALLARFLIL